MKQIALVAVAVCILTTGLPAEACRCAQRTLADYFDGADLVAFGTVAGNQQQGNQRNLTFTLVDNAFKGALLQGQSAQLVSALDTAACGIDPLPDTVYVLFGMVDPAAPGRLRIDTCSGTRPLAGDEDGFIDVPERFVDSQLTALQGMEILTAYSASQAATDQSEDATLIGLLDLEPLAHGGVVSLRQTPDDNAAVLARVKEISELVNREVSYEFSAAAVYGRNAYGYRLQLSDGRFGWITQEEGGAWWPYESLVVQRLNYTVAGWHGLLWPDPGAGIPMRLRNHRGQSKAARVLESTRLAGSLWLRIEVLDTDGCEGDEARVQLSGWTPAFLSSGEPAVWYHSRGC